MNRDEIRRVQFARPFRAFSIHLTDGREFTVDQPEFLMHSRFGRNIIFLTPDDRYQLLDLRQITSLSGIDLPEEPVASAGGSETDSE